MQQTFRDSTYVNSLRWCKIDSVNSIDYDVQAIMIPPPLRRSGYHMCCGNYSVDVHRQLHEYGCSTIEITYLEGIGGHVHEGSATYPWSGDVLTYHAIESMMTELDVPFCLQHHCASDTVHDYLRDCAHLNNQLIPLGLVPN